MYLASLPTNVSYISVYCKLSIASLNIIETQCNTLKADDETMQINFGTFRQDVFKMYNTFDIDLETKLIDVYDINGDKITKQYETIKRVKVMEISIEKFEWFCQALNAIDYKVTDNCVIRESKRFVMVSDERIKFYLQWYIFDNFNFWTIFICLDELPENVSSVDGYCQLIIELETKQMFSEPVHFRKKQRKIRLVNNLSPKYVNWRMHGTMFKIEMQLFAVNEIHKK